MGVRNNRTMQTSAGLTVPARSYISVGTNELILRKTHTNTYTLHFVATLWKDQDARNNNISAIKSFSYNIPITARGLGANMYTAAYTHVKTVYSDTTDV